VVDEALGRLAEWSLLSFTLGGQVVAAHRLVLRVVREHLAQQGRLTAVCRAAASTLNAHATILVGSQDHLAVRNVPEQVAALQQATAKLPEGTGGLEAALLDLRFWAQYHLNGLGDSAEQAIAVGEPLVEDYERLVGNHPSTLAARNNLAAAYRTAGRTSEVIPLLERTLSDRERLLGPDHPDTLASRNNLGNAYRTAGRVAEAIALHERTVADMERLLGPDHPSTLISRSNLALAYQGASRAVHAPPRRRGWSLRRRSAPQHPDS
jgi:tetratricopeptide (TPR) repeat protein